MSTLLSDVDPLPSIAPKIPRAQWVRTGGDGSTFVLAARYVGHACSYNKRGPRRHPQEGCQIESAPERTWANKVRGDRRKMSENVHLFRGYWYTPYKPSATERYM